MKNKYKLKKMKADVVEKGKDYGYNDGFNKILIIWSNTKKKGKMN